MNITSNWREYHSDYKELNGNGFIANLIDPSYFVNKLATEAFVGVAKFRGKEFIPSIGRVWDLDSYLEGSHGVFIYFFNPWGKLLGGEEAEGAHQFTPGRISLEERLKVIKIASDLILVKPELILPFHKIVTRL